MKNIFSMPCWKNTSYKCKPWVGLGCYLFCIDSLPNSTRKSIETWAKFNFQINFAYRFGKNFWQILFVHSVLLASSLYMWYTKEQKLKVCFTWICSDETLLLWNYIFVLCSAIERFLEFWKKADFPFYMQKTSPVVSAV